VRELFDEFLILMNVLVKLFLLNATHTYCRLETFLKLAPLSCQLLSLATLHSWWVAQVPTH